MAKLGTVKRLSVEQEEHVARQYGGRRSPSSGATPTDLGDVKVADEDTLFECKGRFGERVGAKPVRSTLVQQMEKVADEAWQGGQEPALALRFYLPDSPLANREGWVDLTVRLLVEDAVRSQWILRTLGSVRTDLQTTGHEPTQEAPNGDQA